MSDTTLHDELYHVVRNHEEQYSVWRADREVPKGWDTVGESAPKEECLSRIEELWTDMRPLSLRTFMKVNDE
ncbi:MULTISPECIES: MbtH family protein [Streptomyces]|uniref:MbtH family protein n=1 Tax=Streptomyces TaxID=1883 RepID=UPI000A1E8012|nr:MULTISPECIES: MbtH family NRPS accessory protein [Streptomyces]WDO05118.1 MbtH family NRPS accessory protein [Streptomyces murinus]WUD10443.1 MbtH family NRPS accessory protein [Streptomyces murinus]